MMKNLIALILVSLMLAVPVFAQEEVPLTQQEWNIYYDYVEKLDVVPFEQIAADNGVSGDQLSAIVVKAQDYGITEEEKAIMDNLLSRLPQSDPTDEEWSAAEAASCQKFGITKKRMHSIQVRSIIYLKPGMPI